MIKNKKGLFITLEGGDGVGKSTQLSLLSKTFSDSGFDVIATREPGPFLTSVGADIRNIVKNKDMHPETEMLLFFADRVEHVKSVIIPALNDGKIVISDRFYDSTRAYQGVNYGQENADKVELLIRHFVSDCTPDLTLYLDADPENVLNRAVEVGKFENKDFDFHIKVREAFLNIAKDYSYRIKIIDAEKTLYDVYRNIVDVVNQSCNLNLQYLSLDDVNLIVNKQS